VHRKEQNQRLGGGQQLLRFDRPVLQELPQPTQRDCLQQPQLVPLEMLDEAVPRVAGLSGQAADSKAVWDLPRCQTGFLALQQPLVPQLLPQTDFRELPLALVWSQKGCRA
jgi:hypothetical protein